MPIQELEKEILYFEQHREDLLKQHQGKFVLIKGDQCFGAYDTAENAYQEGARKFPGEAILIRQVLQEDLVNEMPAFCTGLLYASF
ncbi:MAG: hypothetical protein GXY07_08125 [Candidatus Hydrogenedentes bacterium]|nr:hypothetical protein [Candidatus Hydrogenedentota bacterium]